MTVDANMCNAVLTWTRHGDVDICFKQAVTLHGEIEHGATKQERCIQVFLCAHHILNNVWLASAKEACAYLSYKLFVLLFRREVAIGIGFTNRTCMDYIKPGEREVKRISLY